MTHRLSRMFSPKTIAVVGGGAWCSNVVKACERIDCDGEIWPVHPSHETIGGRPVFKSIEDLPSAPDGAFIGVNRNAAIEVTRALSAKGCGGAVSFASGFREADAETGDGAALEAALLEAAGSMPLVGPNCYGFINFLEGAALWPDQHGGTRCESGVAIICQSSNIAMNVTMQRRGLPLAFVMSAGNQAQVSLAEIGTAMIEDPRVTAVGLHIEGITEIGDFITMAKAAKKAKKPIVALKVGASDQAKAATMAHTASLAGSGAGASAVLSRLGIAEVDTVPALVEALKLLHITGPLATNEIASLSCSGGEAALIADLAMARNVVFPPLDAERKAALREVLGPKVALANPLDYHTYIWGKKDELAACFTAMAKGNTALPLIILDFPRADRCSTKEWDIVLEAAAEARIAADRPMAIVSTFAETMPEDAAERAIAAGIAPMNGIGEALRAIDVAAWLGQAEEVFVPPIVPGTPSDPQLVDEADAKKMLSLTGLDVPAQRKARSPEEAADAADRIGYPVVLKGLGVAHKTEAGLVRIGLEDADQVRGAALAMDAEEFLVEELIEGGIVELLVGITLDPAHGFVLTLGAGGTMTEILQDATSLIVPAGPQEIDAALDSLRIAPMLDGFRGAPGVDRAAIRTAVAALQLFVASHASRLVELEINPIICRPDRAVAVDALLRMGDV